MSVETTYETLFLLSIRVCAKAREREDSEHAPDAAPPSSVDEDLANRLLVVQVTLHKLDVGLIGETARRGCGHVPREREELERVAARGWCTRVRWTEGVNEGLALLACRPQDENCFRRHGRGTRAAEVTVGMNTEVR